jgi:hypothetical protein
VSDDKEREAFEEWWRTTGRYLTAGKSLARASWDEARTRVSPQGEPVAWICVECGAFWRKNPDGSWNCPCAVIGSCCDNPRDGRALLDPLFRVPPATHRVEAPEVEEKYVPRVGDVVDACGEPRAPVWRALLVRQATECAWDVFWVERGDSGNTEGMAYHTPGNGPFLYVRPATPAERVAAGIDKADPAVAFLDAMARWHHDNKVEYAVVKDAASAYLASRGVK